MPGSLRPMRTPDRRGASERLGVLGGTFDPPHVGHAALAEAARDAFDLDRVLLVVAGDPWQKRGEVEASAGDRLVMAEVLAEGLERVEVSDVEVRREGPTYTADTLEELERPGRLLFLVVGEDVATGFSTWHDAERVRERATVLVAARAGRSAELRDGLDRLRREGWECETIPMPPVPVSSTEVRERLAEGRPVDGLLPPEVVRVVEERSLYTRHG